MNQSADVYPLLLCVPGINATAGEHRLALSEEDYVIRQADDLWKVMERSTGELIYAGPGPVQIWRSPAPF